MSEFVDDVDHTIDPCPVCRQDTLYDCICPKTFAEIDDASRAKIAMCTALLENAFKAMEKQDDAMESLMFPGPKPSTKTLIGIGGAPTRAITLPSDPVARKKHPVASGVLDYFPDAIAAIARVSWQGNEQHNPGHPLHWDRTKSTDEADTMLRHFLERGSLDVDGQRHSAKMAWRALAILQKEIEGESR